MHTFLFVLALSALAVAAQDLTNFPSATETPGQQASLAVWPKDPATNPLGCWKTTAIRSNATGWPGQCMELQQYVPPEGDASQVTVETCKAQCYGDVQCSVWQFSTESGCYSGTGVNCLDRAGETPLTVTGAERIQRGDVQVLKNMNGTWVFGLRNIGVFSSGTAATNSGRCRDWCYANLNCQYWQFGQNGCWAEDRANGYTAQFPLTLTTDASATTGAISSSVAGDDNPARTLISAEYIQHVCPKAGTPAPPQSKSKNLMLYIGLAVLGLLVSAVALFMMCCGKASKRSTRAVKKTRAVKSAPEAEVANVAVEPESLPLIPLVVPASIPMMQYAPAQAMQYAPAPAYQQVAQFQQPMQQFQAYVQ